MISDLSTGTPAKMRLPLFGRYSTLIRLHRLVGIPYFGFNYHAESGSTGRKRSTMHLLSITEWFLCAVMMMNSLYSMYLFLYNGEAEVFFKLLPNQSTRLARGIAGSQQSTFFMVMIGEFLYHACLGKQMNRIVEDIQLTLRQLPTQDMKLHVIRQVNLRMIAYYGGIATLTVVGWLITGIVHSTDQTASQIRKLVHFMQNITFFLLDFSLQGHILYVSVFYGAIFRSLGKEIINLATISRSSDQLLSLFTEIHSRIDKSRDAFGLCIALKIPVVIAFFIQDIYLVILWLIKGYGDQVTGADAEFGWRQFYFFLYMTLHLFVWIVSICLSAQYLTDSWEHLYQQLYDQIHKPEVQSEIGKYEMLRGRSCAYTGCDYFTLGKSLIITILGSAITYSVILLQSDDGS